MTIQGLGSPFTQGISGVSGVARTEEERRQSRKTSEEAAALDPRATFDADIDAMLGGVSDTRAAGATGAAGAAGATGPQADPASRGISTGDSFSRSSSQNDDPGTYTARGRLKQTQAAPVAQAEPAAPVVTTGAVAAGSLASEPAVVPAAANAGSGSSEEEDKSGAKAAGDLSAEEEKQVEKLRQRDQEVRAHEQAHQATGGEHAGGASYTYQRGPDNRQYAIGGSVPIDVSPIPDDPEATVAKAEKVRAAAMAPASPSGADQQVAAKASQMAAKARAEQSEKALDPEKDEDSGLIGQSGQSEKSDTSGKSGKSEKSDKSEQTEMAVDSDMSGTSEKSEKSDNATGIVKAEKAAESGLISQNAPMSQSAQTSPTSPTSQTSQTSQTGQTGQNATSGQSVAGNGAVSAAANTLQMPPPRPAESASATAAVRGDAASEPSATVASLQQLGQAASEAAARADTPRTVADTRAMSRASAAYARVRGETGLAPLNTGISMAV